MLSMACVDDGAGNASLQIQGEVAKYIIGNKGSRTLRVGGQDDISYISGTGTAGADGNGAEQTVKSITLAANSLAKVGDRIRIKAVIEVVGAGSPTFRVRLNGVNLFGVATQDGSFNTKLTVDVSYIDDTHANYEGVHSKYDATTVWIGFVANTAGFSHSSAQALIVTQLVAAGTHIVVYE